MTWTAPPVTRADGEFAGGERATLDGFLDWYRGTLLDKCAGLTGEQLARRAVPPSRLSLLGLLRHMTEVERGWFRRRIGGQEAGSAYCTGQRPDADFDDAVPASAEADYAAYLRELDLARAAAAGQELGQTFVHERHQTEMNVRWVYAHMIEEYARHVGHADPIRECIDGRTGS
ncbi:MAG TPA: DinB family protein [Streptosporangiaceae bacterium]